MKRLVSLMLILVLMLLLTGVPAAAEEEKDNALKGAIGKELLEKSMLPEDEPYLALYVEYEKTEQYCTTHAKATLLYVNGNGKSDNPAAQDIIIELKTEDTLELLEGSDYHVFFDDLPCGEQYTFEFDLFCEFPMEEVEKAPEPKLTINVRSANAGSCKYTCTFDSTTEPRAFIWGWETGDTAPRAIQNDVAMMNELFGRSYYNMQPVEVAGHTHYNHPNIGLLYDQFLETDHNDVTYIYINTHGPTLDYKIFPGFLAYAPGTSVEYLGSTYTNKNLVAYSDFFRRVQANVKGKVVVIFDICYSGQAIGTAEEAGFGSDQMSLLTAVDSNSGSGVYDNWLTRDYGWFTKEIYEEFSGRTGQLTIGDVYSFTRHHADTTIQLGQYATINPQFTGNSDTVVFCFDPDAWMEDPEFVVVSETLTARLPIAVVVTTDTYVDEAEHFSARVVRPHVYAEANPNLTAIVDAAIDEMYQEKMDRVERSRANAPSCTYRTNDHRETLTLTSAFSSGGFLTLGFQKGYFDCSIGHNVNQTIVYRFDVATGKQIEMEDLLDFENNPNAKEDFIEQIGVQLEKEGASASDASKVYSEALRDRYANWDISPRGIEFSIDRLNSGVGCWGAMVPYENLSGILKEKYLPKQGDGFMTLSLEPYDAEAAAQTDLTLYENTPAAAMLTVEGQGSHLWIKDFYGNLGKSLDGTCDCFYAYGLSDALITLPEPDHEEKGYEMIWIDSSSGYFLNMVVE